MKMKIGGWVRRRHPTRTYTVWHHVESIVAEAVITKCGLRMEPHTKSQPTLTLEFSEILPLSRNLLSISHCVRCKQRV